MVQWFTYKTFVFALRCGIAKKYWLLESSIIMSEVPITKKKIKDSIIEFIQHTSVMFLRCSVAYFYFSKSKSFKTHSCLENIYV